MNLPITRGCWSLLGFTLLIGCSDSTGAEEPSPPIGIVVAQSPADFENWVIAPEGGTPTPLPIPGFTSAWHLVVAHGGDQVAFIGLPEGNAQASLFVAPLGPEGIGLPVLVVSSPDDQLAWPRWSPDDQLISFSRWTSGAVFPELWLVSPGGTGARRIAVDAGEADWSPDGDRLVFSTYISAIDFYYRRPSTIQRDGSGRVDLPGAVCAPPCVDVWAPRWSSSGRLAILRYSTASEEGEPGRYEVAVLETPESAPEVSWSGDLMANGGEPSFAWDPSGANRLALTRAVDDAGLARPQALYLVDVASGQQQALTDPLYYQAVSDWR